MSQTSEIMVFDSLLGRSNLRSREKSMIRDWADKMTGGRASDYMERTHHAFGGAHLSAGLDTLRQGAEGVSVGAMLGALSAYNALDPMGVPVDGVGGAFLTILGVAGAHHEAGKDARNAGIAGMTVFSFRKVDKLLRTMRHGTVAGEDETCDSDPDESPGIDHDGVGRNVGSHGADVGADEIVEFAKTL